MLSSATCQEDVLPSIGTSFSPAPWPV